MSIKLENLKTQFKQATPGLLTVSIFSGLILMGAQRHDNDQNSAPVKTPKRVIKIDQKTLETLQNTKTIIQGEDTFRLVPKKTFEKLVY